MNVLARRYGITGKHLWLACQGATRRGGAGIAPPKSVGHGKVLPPHTTSAAHHPDYLRHMCEKVAARLRRLDMQAGNWYVGLRTAAPGAGIEAVLTVAHGAPDGRRFFEQARALFREQWHGER